MKIYFDFEPELKTGQDLAAQWSDFLDSLEVPNCSEVVESHFAESDGDEYYIELDIISSAPGGVLEFIQSDDVTRAEESDLPLRDFNYGDGWTFTQGEQAIRDAGYEFDSRLTLYANSGADDCLLLSNAGPGDITEFMNKEDSSRADVSYFVIPFEEEGLYNKTHSVVDNSDLLAESSKDDESLDY